MTDIKHNLYFKPDDAFVKGFQEVVMSVSNMEKATSFYQNVCGWEIVSHSYGNSDLKKLWHLSDTVEIEEVLLRNPGDTEGFLRLVRFNNVAQKQIRSGTHIWDSGGIFDINIRTNDMESLYHDFQREGWNGYTDPLPHDFDIYKVTEVLLKGPDGITVAAIQRHQPSLDDSWSFEKASRIFNTSIISKDIEVTRDFFIDKLGFQLFIEEKGTNRKEGANLMGLPPNINQDITLPIIMVRPDIKNYGSVEILEPKEIKGKDCASLAKPPNLGILMLRFPVKDADAYATALKEKDVHLQSEVLELQIEPYGTVKVFSVLSPDGVWLEFMQLITP